MGTTVGSTGVFVVAAAASGDSCMECPQVRRTSGADRAKAEPSREYCT